MLRWSLDRSASANRNASADLDRPELLPGLSGWYDAFFELSTDRQIGMGGPGPIPASSIARYTSGWPDADAEAFQVCMRAMDAVYRTPRSALPPPADDMDGEARLRVVFGGLLDE